MEIKVFNDNEEKNDIYYMYDAILTNTEINKLKGMARSKAISDNVRDRLFQLRREYKNIQRFASKEIEKRLSIYNDPVIRFSEKMTMEMTPEAVQSALSELSDLVKQSEQAIREHEDLLESFSKPEETKQEQQSVD